MTPPAPANNNLLIPTKQTVFLVVVSLSLGAAMLVGARGIGRYDAPGFGGPEPAETQRGAVEILATGRTDMTFHSTGYSYLIAAAYTILPDVPVSMLWVQVASLPILVWAIQYIVVFLLDERARNWAIVAGCLYYPFGYYAGTFNSVYITAFFFTLGVAWFLPITVGSRSLVRSLAVGLALGVAVCCRPNFAILGIFYSLQLWKSHRSIKEAFVRSLPIAAVSIGMLATMVYLNPPGPGQFMRGSHLMNRSLLLGTYQYAYRWWDWEWMLNSSDQGAREFAEHSRRIEAETGHPVSHPDSQSVVGREAWKRIWGQPGNTIKKILLSSVRGWILIPTHVSSMPLKVAFAVQELILLFLALAGLWIVFRARGPWIVLLGVLLIPTVFNWLATVEPRLSLPGKPIELALAVVAFVSLLQRWAGSGEKSVIQLATPVLKN